MKYQAIRHLIRKAKETGEWNPDYAVKKYMEQIGETKVEKIVVLLERIKEKTKNNKISSKLLKEVSGKLNLQANIGKIIVELKGGRIISPCLRNSVHPVLLQYEINPSLFKLLN